MKGYYITAPIFYPNADLHMGHAYTSVLCDVLARYRRLRGEDVYFLVGNDENASKVAKAAVAAGRDPKEFVDEQARKFKDFYRTLDVSADTFMQTSDRDRHWAGALRFWEKLAEAGDIEKRKYQGLYCVGCESFKTEKDLVDGLCPDHNVKPELVEEENYFFLLSRYTNRIKELVLSGKLAVLPETRKNEVLALLDRGLEDVSFSRPAGKVYGWGIPVPGDPDQVMYVWCDALTNYVTALGYGSQDEGPLGKFWPADVHMVGKDILRFHATVWPAMLLSAGLPVPKAVFAHGFITSGGKKMSKTIGNVIDPKALIADYGADSLRYFLTREISPTDDGDVTEMSFKESYNANLANGLGNLVSRVLRMATANGVSLGGQTFSLRGLPAGHPLVEGLEQFQVNWAMDYVWSEIQSMDERIAETEPYKLVKEEGSRAEGVRIIGELLENLWRISFYLEPFMPQTALRIRSLAERGEMPESPLFLRKE